MDTPAVPIDTGTVGSGSYPVISTASLLDSRVNALKKQRKHEKAEKREESRRQSADMIKNVEIFNKLMSDQPIKDHPVVPTSAASKMAHGRAMMQSPRLTAKELLIQDPDSLAHIADIDEKVARTSQLTVRETLGLDNFQEHFLAPEHFLEKGVPPGAGSKASVGPAVTAPSRTKKRKNPSGLLASETLPHLPSTGDATISKALMDIRERVELKLRETQDSKMPKKDINLEDTPIEERPRKKTRTAPVVVETASAVPTPPLKRSEISIVNLSGRRDMTANEIKVMQQIVDSDIKTKPERHKWQNLTETALSGNEAVRAMRRGYLTSNTLNKEAAKTFAHDETQERPPEGGLTLPDPNVMDLDQVDTPGLAAVETRNMAVIDESFYAPHPGYAPFATVGEKNASEMITERLRPSKLPALPITSLQAKEVEHGRERVNLTIMTEVSRDHAAFAVTEKDKVLPMFCYVRDFTKPSDIATMGWTEGIVSDTKQLITSLLTAIKQYKVDPSDPAHLLVTDNGRKVLSAEARQHASNLKKRRDTMVGREAEYDPVRMRMHLPHHRVTFCMTRWNKRDAAFVHDWPAVIGGQLVERENPSVVVPDRRRLRDVRDDPNALIKLCVHGAIGAMISRCRDAINAREGRTGIAHLISAEELGTSRLHPSVNPHIPRVTLEYHLKYMEQPMENDRPCMNGEHCVCNTSNISRTDNTTYLSATNTLHFICREYLSEAEETLFLTSGELPRKRKQCICCYMLHVTRLHMANMEREIQPVKPIHDHCVFTDVPGQYRSEKCLPMSYKVGGKQIATGVIEMFPHFEMTNYVYSIKLVNGCAVRCLRPNQAKLLF